MQVWESQRSKMRTCSYSHQQSHFHVGDREEGLEAKKPGFKPKLRHHHAMSQLRHHHAMSQPHPPLSLSEEGLCQPGCQGVICNVTTPQQ